MDFFVVCFVFFRKYNNAVTFGEHTTISAAPLKCFQRGSFRPAYIVYLHVYVHVRGCVFWKEIFQWRSRSFHLKRWFSFATYGCAYLDSESPLGIDAVMSSLPSEYTDHTRRYTTHVFMTFSQCLSEKSWVTTQILVTIGFPVDLLDYLLFKEFPLRSNDFGRSSSVPSQTSVTSLH